jgi:hypothetical protein
MNKTTFEHFLKYFPNENISGFDTVYYTQGGEDDFAFILVKGAMEDIQVFTHGNYNEESLEKRLFGLISTYNKSNMDYGIFYNEMSESEMNDYMIRDELIYSHKFQVNETLQTVLFICVLFVFEALAVFFLYLFGITDTNIFLVIAACLVVDSILFFIFNPRSLRKEDEKW